MKHRSNQPSFFPGFLGLAGALALASVPAAQVGTVDSEQKISATAGGFGGALDASDEFGNSVACLGDLDGDGNEDLAVGARSDDDGGGFDKGAVWILFLNSDGTVDSEQKISATAGGFGGVLSDSDRFGSSVTGLGDLDGDGNPDLAVGAFGDGAVWILLLNSDGTVASETRISRTSGGFGVSVASLGDLDGDGTGDLAVGAYSDNDGAVWIFFLNPDGTVDSEQKISETAGNFGGVLDPGDGMGSSVAALGDLDGDGNEDLAVGAYGDDDGGFDHGAVWILFLNSDGTVASEQKISETAGGFGGVLDFLDWFGFSLGSPGDLDGDGNQGLAVNDFSDFDEGDQGSVWILFLNSDGTVASEQKINEMEGGFGGVIDAEDYFGFSVAGLGDLDGDGNEDLAAGVLWDDDGGFNQGAVWILFLEGPDAPPPHRPGRPTVTGPTSPVLFPSTASPEGPSTLPLPGGVSLRNGSGVNELCLSSASTPLAGEEWQVRVDLSAHPGASRSLVIVSDRALRGTRSPFGELLIDPLSRKPLFTSLVVSPGATHLHELPIPAQALGQSFSLQALIFDGRESVLTNGLDIVIGRRP